MNMQIINDITDFIFIADEPQQADIIFIPGCGNPDVPEKGVELYKAGYVSFLLPSGGVGAKLGKFAGVTRKADIYNGDYQTDCDFLTDVLLKNDVPHHAIIKENQSRYTKENATLSRIATDEKGLVIRKAIVVCKSFHARRCLMCYQLAFPEAEITVVPVDVYGISRDNWYQQAYGIKRVMGELARCGSQFEEEVKIYCGQ